MNMKSEFSELRNLSTQLSRWKLIKSILLLLFAFFVSAALIQAFHITIKPKEIILIIFSITLTILTLFVFIGFVWKYLKSDISTIALARTVEKNHPELMDYLNCAVEMSQNKTDELSDIERLVLFEAKRKLSQTNIKETSGITRDEKFFIISLFLATAVGFSSILTWPVSSQLYHALNDLITGQQTGLSVTPGTAEFPIHSDINVEAVIHRGIKQAKIEYKTHTTQNTLLTYPKENHKNQFNFTFFDTIVDTEYRIITPDFTSQWYKLTIYPVPVIEDISWHVTPPSYTGLKSFVVLNAGNLAIPEGSDLITRLSSPDNQMNVNLSFDGGQKKLTWKESFYEADWGAKEYFISGKEEFDIYFVATNKKGYSAESENIRIAVIKDSSPVVEIVQPGTDIGLTPDDSTLIKIFSSDDYGLSSLQLVVGIGDKMRYFPMRIDGDTDHEILLSMNNLGVNPGDLVSYYARASDNKVTENQSSRSDIYFIEIYSSKDQSDRNDQQNSSLPSGSSQRELPVREFIERTKQIIRKGFSVSNKDSVTGSPTLVDLSQEALVLKQDMHTVYIKNRTSLRIVDGVDSSGLLKMAVESMENTVSSLDNQLLDFAIDQSSAALRYLVRLDSLLRRMSASSSGKSSSEPGDADKNSEQQGHDSRENSQKNILSRIDVIKKVLEETRILIDKQKNINLGMGKAKALSEEVRMNLAQKQKDTAVLTEKLSRQFYDSTGKLGPSSLLRAAQTHMLSSHDYLQDGQSEQAIPEGARSLESLQMAAVNLKEELFNLAGEVLNQTRQKGEYLTQHQLSLMESTGNSTETDKQESEQKRLNDSIRGFSADLEMSAKILHGVSERLSEAIRDISSSKVKKALEKHQDRAVNSLVYGLKDQAQSEQKEISEILKHQTNRITQLQIELSGEQTNQIAGRLRKINEILSSLKKSSPDKLKSFASSLSEQLKNDLLTQSDYRLQESQNHLDLIGKREGNDYVKEDLEWVLQKTRDVLQPYLWEKVIENTIQQSRENYQMPEQYRKAVEDYFRRLAEDSSD